MVESIRRASADDVSAVSSIDASVNVNPWPKGRIEALCAPEAPVAGRSLVEQCLLVAQVDGAICGFIVVSCLPQEGEIQNLGVRGSVQGRGLGAALVGAALELLRARSAQRCLLEVRQTNKTARRLYERSGFKVDGIRKNYYQSEQGREDAILMSLDLGAELEQVE